MNNELVKETVSAYYAGHVDVVMGQYVRITAREYNTETDVCTVWTTSASKDIGSSVFAIQERLRIRTGVKEVSIYATKAGFSVVLSGCIDEYRRWAQKQLRLRMPERIIYFLLGVVMTGLAFFLFV